MAARKSTKKSTIPIRVYDKLLLILFDARIKSDWVNTEIELHILAPNGCCNKRESSERVCISEPRGRGIARLSAQSKSQTRTRGEQGENNPPAAIRLS